MKFKDFQGYVGTLYN